MDKLLAFLPFIQIIHIGSALFLVAIFLLRTYYLFNNLKQAYVKNLVSSSSLLVIAVFISGIIQAFLLKMPFNTPYVLTKIFGLLAFTGFSITAFMPRRRKNTALMMMLIAFIIFIYIMLTSGIA